MKYSLFVLLLSVLFLGCSSTKRLNEFSKNSLIFGSGGGFTRITNTYTLHVDGTLEKRGGPDTQKISITTISPKESKQLFKEYLKEGFDTLSFSQPGNMSYFIGHIEGQDEHKILWGGELPPSENVKVFYEKLLLLIQNEKTN